MDSDRLNWSVLLIETGTEMSPDLSRDGFKNDTGVGDTERSGCGGEKKMEQSRKNLHNIRRIRFSRTISYLTTEKCCIGHLRHIFFPFVPGGLVWEIIQE